jgi:hypothetical protein
VITEAAAPIPARPTAQRPVSVPPPSPVASPGCRSSPTDSPGPSAVRPILPGREQTLPPRRAQHPPSPRLPPPRPVSDSPPSKPEPERLLLDQIAAGELDPHLTAIADVIHACMELVETVNSAKALAMLNVGDRVRFIHYTRPQYLRAVEGVVIELDQHTATVCIHQPIGRAQARSGGARRCYSSACTHPPDEGETATSRTTATAELDSLIEEITIDCYDEDESSKDSRTTSTRTRPSHAPGPSSAKRSKFCTLD